MNKYVEERVLDSAKFIVNNKATVRACAKALGCSKSTVHKDVTERLLTLDENLHAEVRVILDLNLSERHLRGGLATKQKFKNRI